MKVPLLDPAAIASDPEAVLILPVVPRVTFAPPVPLSFTVQVVAPPGLKEVGVHVSELMVTAETSVIVPPVAAREMALPSGVAPKTPLTPTLMEADPETVADTVATTPFAIVLAFTPLATHLRPPVVEAQVTVLTAAVSAAPAVTETLETVVG